MWHKNNKDPITQVPRLYCNSIMLTGECDGLINGVDLVDWKCSAMANERIWNMQAHMYYYLLGVNGYTVSERMKWVNLKHKKTIRRDQKSKLGTMIFYAQEPQVYEFKFDQNVLSECLDEVNKYWEEYSCAKVLA